MFAAPMASAVVLAGVLATRTREAAMMQIFTIAMHRQTDGKSAVC